MAQDATFAETESGDEMISPLRTTEIFSPFKITRKSPASGKNSILIDSLGCSPDAGKPIGKAHEILESAPDLALSTLDDKEATLRFLTALVTANRARSINFKHLRAYLGGWLLGDAREAYLAALPSFTDESTLCQFLTETLAMPTTDYFLRKFQEPYTSGSLGTFIREKRRQYQQQRTISGSDQPMGMSEADAVAAVMSKESLGAWISGNQGLWVHLASCDGFTGLLHTYSMLKEAEVAVTTPGRRRNGRNNQGNSRRRNNNSSGSSSRSGGRASDDSARRERCPVCNTLGHSRSGCWWPAAGHATRDAVDRARAAGYIPRRGRIELRSPASSDSQSGNGGESQ